MGNSPSSVLMDVFMEPERIRGTDCPLLQACYESLVQVAIQYQQFAQKDLCCDFPATVGFKYSQSVFLVRFLQGGSNDIPERRVSKHLLKGVF